MYIVQKGEKKPPFEKSEYLCMTCSHLQPSKQADCELHKHINTSIPKSFNSFQKPYFNTTTSLVYASENLISNLV